jgi:hypothetical protein
MNKPQTTTPVLSSPSVRAAFRAVLPYPEGNTAAVRSRVPTPKPAGGKWRGSAILLVSHAGGELTTTPVAGECNYTGFSRRGRS